MSGQDGAPARPSHGDHRRSSAPTPGTLSVDQSHHRPLRFGDSRGGFSPGRTMSDGHRPPAGAGLLGHDRRPTRNVSFAASPSGVKSPTGMGAGFSGFGRTSSSLRERREAKAKLKAQSAGKPVFSFPKKQPPPTAEPAFSAKDPDLGVLTYDGQTVSCEEDEVAELEDLGKGAFGIVRKMRHKKLKVDFAVKQIRDSMDERLRKQLKTDLQVIKQCDCRHIVNYHGFNFTEGEVWIFMELMRSSLDLVATRVLERDLRFPEPVLGKIADSVLQGLHYLLSKRRIMHRDVKPSNVLLGFDGRIKLCDFGISKIMEKSISKTNVGCERYLPPERLNPETSQQAYDARSDVWAFGVTLVELADLKYPYPEDHTKIYARLEAIVNGEPPQISTEHYSKPFASFVATCLQKDKRKRPKYDRQAEDEPRHCALLDHAFIAEQQRNEFNIDEWFRTHLC